MSILSRIGTIIKSNINAMIDKAEDPEKILNQLIYDMNSSMVEAKKQVASTIADEKRLKKQLDAELMNAQEWERKAMMAVRAGNDQLAKEALARKAEFDNLAAQFQTQWEAQKASADQLKNALRALNNKIEEAKRKKNLLIAKQKRAQAQKMIQQTLSGINDSGAFDTFSRMEEKVNQMEAEAEAAVEMTGEMTGDSLAQKFEQLEADTSDDALAALKSKMGLAPAKVEVQQEQEVTVDAAKKSGGGSTPYAR